MKHSHSSIIFIMCLALAFLFVGRGSAYAQKKVHDSQKEKQWRSMETGPWGWYYYFLHKKYSGAETYWKWSGFKSRYRVRFKEHKSNVKTIMPRRIAQEELQKEKIKKVEEERAKVKEMHDEEVIRAADRNVDLVYSTFKDDFNRMQGAITEGLTFCLTKSKGKLAPQVNELQRQNDLVCQSIAYTHKQGLGNELENSKRQEAYVEYKKQMEEVVSRVAHLVGMAQQYYQ